MPTPDCLPPIARRCRVDYTPPLAARFLALVFFALAAFHTPCRRARYFGRAIRFRYLRRRCRRGVITHYHAIYLRHLLEDATCRYADATGCRLIRYRFRWLLTTLSDVYIVDAFHLLHLRFH